MLAVAALALTPALAACGGDPPAPTPTAGLTAPQADRDHLAGLAAAAKDRRYVATYTLIAKGRSARTVTVAMATDGSWVVAVPAGALSGLADIAVFQSAAGRFQCLLGPAAGTVGQRPDLGTLAPGCTKVGRFTSATDPRVQHVFTDWIDPLTDRATALSVTATGLLPGAHGACFSVESTSAALAPPVDPGTYCYDATGILTAARVGFGVLTLTGPVGAAPPAVALPAPIVPHAPWPVTAPSPPPSPTPSTSPTT